ncbi:MAG: porin [Flavobacteriaceae bacterium]|nr:porin [Flavobacteriaceae bacterium]
MKLTVPFLISLLITTSIFSQKEEIPKNLDFNTYGIFRAHMATFGGEAEIQDASPRVGFKFNYHFGKNNEYTVFFGGEFAINLIDNQFNFQADPNTNDGGFTLLEFRDKKSTFSTRLGFIGVNFDKYGIITLGKLNSVYKDVAGQTDIFNVMSGQASYVYSPDGADGGETGTGRAEGALIYRNTFGRFNIGLQTQMRANGGDNFFDSYSASLRFKLTDYLTLGTAYNKALLGPRFLEINNVQGLEGDPWYLTAGLVYDKGPLFISGTFVNQENGDFINTIDPVEEDIASIVYHGKGFELVTSYIILNNKLKLLAGFNYKKPETDNALLPDDFRKRLYLIGAQYRFIKYASIYSEYKFEDSINGLGLKPKNVFMLGLRIDFNKTWSRNVEL